MTNLRAMNERMNAWMAEKPQFDGGTSLYMNKGDIVIFQFCSSGDDGDKLIKPYRAHSFEVLGKNGRPRQETRYCPIRSGDTDIACPHCEAGNTVIKERFAVWFYVHNILHAQMPQDKQFPQVQYEGGYYFNEEVMGFKLWETSAWRESPWLDIVKLNEMYKGLHNFTARIDVVGEQLTRRFKLYAIPNSAFLDPGVYERAKQECQSIPDRLRLEINQAVAANPQAQAVNTLGAAITAFATPNPNPQMPQVTPFTTPGASIPPLVLPGLSAVSQPSSPTPTLSVPTIVTPSTPTPEPEPLTVGLVTTLPDPEPGDSGLSPFETEPVKDDLPLEEDTKPVEAARRPLKSMF